MTWFLYNLGYQSNFSILKDFESIRFPICLVLSNDFSNFKWKHYLNFSVILKIKIKIWSNSWFWKNTKIISSFWHLNFKKNTSLCLKTLKRRLLLSCVFWDVNCTKKNAELRKNWRDPYYKVHGHAKTYTFLTWSLL